MMDWNRRESKALKSIFVVKRREELGSWTRRVSVYFKSKLVSSESGRYREFSSEGVLI